MKLTIASSEAPGWKTSLWTACAVIHPLLDMLTDGGAGVMLLYPFSEARLFFPWRPIRVSPLGITGFYERAPEILRSEALFDCAAILAGLGLRLVTAAGRGS